nr:hypothetical protein [Tanacetum cinerariifolium]
MTEDFVYQVEHKDAKKSNEMYCPRFTKVIVNYFITKDQSIPRSNKVNWHFARDDHMFTTIKLVSRHQNPQQYGAILHVELTNEAIRNSESYKEYYAIVSGAEPPKTKASVRKKQSSSDTTMPPPTAKGKRLKTSANVDKPAKEKQPAKSSKAKDDEDNDEDSHDRLRDEVQAKNEDFLNKLDENIQKIIKEQVKEQVKVRVSKILPKIEKTVNEQLEAEVLTRSSNSFKTSHDVADDLSKLELKKILIDKMESNKSIHRSDEKKNLYKALVDAYECDKLILDTFGDTVTLKRRRDDKDKDEETSTGSNQGSKRRRAGKEPESTRAPKEKTSKTSGKSTEGSKSHHKTASESAPVEEPMHTTQDLEEPTPQEFETGATDDQPVEEASQHPHYNLAKKADSRTSFNELMDTPVDFSAFMMNQLKVDTLTPELLAGPTYELMKGSCKSLVDFEFFLEEVYKAITNQFDWNNPEGQQYPVKYRLALTNMLFGESRIRGANVNSSMAFLVNRESARDVYSKRRIIAITEIQIVKWHNYKHLDWITVRKDDDKIYKFKEGDFKRLCIQDIEDMLLLLVQGKLTNLTVDERFALNVSL